MRKFSLFLLSSLLCLVANAQLNDNFTDGDFTANPIWTGSNGGADFTVVSNQLRSNSTTASSNFYLSTPSTLANNCQWEFWVNLQFSTSGANYVDVYLISDQSDLQSVNINGYFVRIGNTLDEICLYSRTGAVGTSTKIIDGVDASIATSSTTVKIKVTRTSANLFTLERDLTGTGTSYFTEGTVTDAGVTSSLHFGVFIQQSTATFFQKHFFDEFYVGPIILDVTPPSIVSVTAISSTQCDVLFNEDVDLSTSQTNNNYSVNNGIGNPISASRDGSNLKLVHLTFAAPFTNGLQNTITINGVEDLFANAISAGNSNFTYLLLGTPGFKDLILTEVLVDVNPVPSGIPAKQYIELYNRSSSFFDLNGWMISDAVSSATVSGNYILSPGSYVIIAKSTDTSLFTGISNKIGTTSFPTFNTTGDPVFIQDASSNYIDSIRYTTAWYNDGTKDDGGWSLELINPTLSVNCTAQSNWTASSDVDGGTPGAQNSVFNTTADITSPIALSATVIDSVTLEVCFNESISSNLINVIGNYSINNGIGTPIAAASNAGLTCVTLTLGTPLVSLSNYLVTFSSLQDCSGNNVTPSSFPFTYIATLPASYKDVIINEILVDVNPVPIGIPAKQYLELYNRSTKHINLNGWQFGDATTSVSTISQNYILAPSSYVLIAKNVDTALFTGIINKIGTSTFPSYNVTTDLIYIMDNNSNYIDSVTYDDAWYNNSAKDDGGWSLELINPLLNANCYPANNWSASNSINGGTPGIQNSIYSVAPDLTAPASQFVSVSDSMHLTICFSEPILTSLALNVSNYSINNGIGQPLAVSVSSGDNNCVDLILGTSLINQTNYQISFLNLSDCSGNNVSPLVASFSYYIAKPYDVVVNEIFPDPDPQIALPNKEYIELYNRSNFAISLKNWVISIGNNDITLPDAVIQPDSFVVFIDDASLTAFINEGYGNRPLVILDEMSTSELNVSDEAIHLKDALGNTISYVLYSDDWYGDEAKKAGGWSLEQIDPSNPCAGGANWKASVNANGGTPGTRNSVNASNPDNSSPELTRVSVYSADTIVLFFNEALTFSSLINVNTYSIDNGIGNPINVIPLPNEYKKVKLKLGTPISSGIIYTVTVTNSIEDCAGNPITISNSARFGLPDSLMPNDVIVNELLFNPKTPGVDFVELYNRSTKTLDLKDLYIGEGMTGSNLFEDSVCVAPEGYLLFAGEFVVLSESESTVKSQFTALNPKWFIDMKDLPSMNDDEDNVVLLNELGTEIDKVAYTDDMHFALLNDKEGISLERIDYERPSSEETNWTSAASTVGFGTPTYKNSQYLETTYGANVTIQPEVFSPDNDGYNDVLNINYDFSEPGKSANLVIYDSKGRFVKSLLKNENIGNKGTISWNGITEENEKAAIGIYVIYFETFDNSGKVTKQKLSCVLAGKL